MGDLCLPLRKSHHSKNLAFVCPARGITDAWRVLFSPGVLFLSTLARDSTTSWRNCCEFAAPT